VSPSEPRPRARPGARARLTARLASPVEVERARARTTAFVYGNILVLSAVLTATPDSVGDGHAALVIAATTVTTYLAHVVAHAVGGVVGRDLTGPPDHGDGRAELRDAVPIASSGTVPTVVLLVAWWTDLPAGPAVSVAAGVTVLRLAGMGLVVGRLSGHEPSGRQWWAGVVLAVVSAVIAVLKVLLTH